MKLREFWIHQWECLASADFAWRSKKNSDLAFEQHQGYVNEGTRSQIEIIHVREVSPARDAAMEQMVKALEIYAMTIESFPEYGTVAKEALEIWRKVNE